MGSMYLQSTISLTGASLTSYLRYLHVVVILFLLLVTPIDPSELESKLQEQQKGRLTIQHQDLKQEFPAPAGDVRLTGKQNILLQHAVKNLLGFGDFPEHATPKPTPKQGKWDGINLQGREEAPKYMSKLYERYKYGGIANDHKQAGNTIRSITANIEMLDGEPMFVFNLSTIPQSESVFSTEIHVYRKRPKSPEHSNAYMLLHQVTPNYLNHIASHQMSERRFGWQSYDITSSVETCLQRAHNKQRLAISFASSRTRTGANKPLPLKHFIRHNMALPFLIIFSNETLNISLDHIDPHFAVKDQPDVIIDPEHGVEVPLYGKWKKSDRLVRDTSRENTGDVSIDEQVNNRKRRSILDNEIPEHPTGGVLPDAPYNVPRTHPGMLQGREAVKGGMLDSVEKKLLPYPDDYEDDRSAKKKRRRERRKNRRRKDRDRGKGSRSKEDRTLPFPPEWERELRKEENTIKVGSQDYLCGRKKLIVDFADVGWSTWIISPKSFEAHYCAGSCPFPLTERLSPSNHATIQSLVNAIGIPADVPAPCCVPQSLTSLSVLFFDHTGNVVLKNYPDMSVETCACR